MFSSINFDKKILTIILDQVELLMTFIPHSAKDDLALFSSSKFIGSYQLQLESEKEMGDFVMRTLKVRINYAQHFYLLYNDCRVFLKIF